MYNIFIYLFMVISCIIILLILCQPSKQQDALSLLSGDKSSTLFKSQKSQSLNCLLQYATALFAVLWIVLGIAVLYLGNH